MYSPEEHRLFGTQVIVLRDDEVLLLRDKRKKEKTAGIPNNRGGFCHEQLKVVWGLPGGGAKIGECVETTAKRELWEELIGDDDAKNECITLEVMSQQLHPFIVVQLVKGVLYELAATAVRTPYSKLDDASKKEIEKVVQSGNGKWIKVKDLVHSFQVAHRTGITQISHQHIRPQALTAIALYDFEKKMSTDDIKEIVTRWNKRAHTVIPARHSLYV